MSLVRPTSNRWLMDWFCWYARRMIRKNFHVFAIDLSTFDYGSIANNVPLVIFSNHPGWWDPIVGMLLCRDYFKDRVFYAPIDAEALNKYRVFRKLGYFGIQANVRKGASDFMDQASYVLQSGSGSLWITPEGRFTDVRDYRQPLMPGLAHLAAKIPNIHCIPLAIEYVFNEQRHPHLLCKLGAALTDTEPIKNMSKITSGFEPQALAALGNSEKHNAASACGSKDTNYLQNAEIIIDQTLRNSKSDWQARLIESLRTTQATLAKAVIAKRWETFDIVEHSNRQASDR